MAFDLARIAQAQAEGKAIPAHPVFQDGAPTSLYVPGGQPQRKQGELSQSEAKRHAEAYGGKEAIDWVMDCIDLYADTTSSAAWHFKKDGKRFYLPDDEEKPDGAPVVEKQLADLFTAPNPFMDYIELMQLLVIDLLLVGNAYWYKYRMAADGKPLALYRLSPSDVRVIPGPYGVENYVYKPRGQKDKINIAPNEIVHFKRPNPHDPWYGLGVIRGGGRPLDLELALTDSQAHFFENKADPSMIVQSDRRVPRDVFKKLTQQLRSRASGTRNAGELLVLEAGLKASTLDRNARDAMYKELATASRDRILAMFRVSPKLLGITETGGGQDKVTDSRREFDNKVIRPFLDKLETRITSQLVAAWGYKYGIDYKYVMPPEELVKLASDLGGVPGIKVKEVRGFLVEGGIIREELTGDKDIDDLVLNLPGEDLGPDGQPLVGGAGFADRSLPREAGRPPLGENTKAIPKGSQALPAGAKARRPKGKALPVADVLARLEEMKALPEFSQSHRSTVGNHLPDERAPKDTLEQARTEQLNAVIDDTRTDIMQAVLTLERGLLDHVEGKAFNPSTLSSRIRKSPMWKAFLGLLTVALEKGTKNAASVAAVQQIDAGFDPQGTIDYDAIAKSVVFRADGVNSITDNLQEEILKKVTEAAAEGKSRGEVEAIVRESIDFWRQHKAETVAMTEAIHAYNETTLTVFELSGFNEVAVFDGDHDDPCIEANGSIWTIDHARKNRLEHPRCRRAFGAVAAQESVA